MPRYRTVSWSRIDYRPPAPPSVREEPLAGSYLLQQRVTSWRGLSGRSYVFAVHRIADAVGIEAPGAVILGVRRNLWQTGLIVGAGHRGTVAEAIALCSPDGATEIHLHHLAERALERDAIIADLVEADDL